MDPRTLADSGQDFGRSDGYGSQGCGMSEHLPDTAVPPIFRTAAWCCKTLANAPRGDSQGLAAHAVQDDSGAGLAGSNTLIDGCAEQQVARSGHLPERQAQIGIELVRATLPRTRNRKADVLAVHPVSLVSANTMPLAVGIAGTSPAGAIPEEPLAPGLRDAHAGPSHTQGTGPLGQRNRPADLRLRVEAGAAHPPRHASQTVTPGLRARGELHRPLKARPEISRAERSC